MNSNTKKISGIIIITTSEQEFSQDSSNSKLRHPTGRHDDLFWALCLALYRFTTKNSVKFDGASVSIDGQMPNSNSQDFVKKFLRDKQMNGMICTEMNIKYQDKDWEKIIFCLTFDINHSLL